MLTRSAYADDRHLRSRMGILAYAEQPPSRDWRTSAVPWDGTQVVADIGCGNGFDLRQLVPDKCRHAFGIDLSDGMLRTLTELRATGRLALSRADAQQLPLRTDSVDVAMAMHMLYHVPRIDRAVAELRRIVNPDGTVLASTNSATTMSEVHELFDAVVSELIGRKVTAFPALGFTTETGGALLGTEFTEVTLIPNEVVLVIPESGPVVAYVNSVREPVAGIVGEPFDFDVALERLAARVDNVIAELGVFRTVSRTGVFVCR